MKINKVPCTFDTTYCVYEAPNGKRKCMKWAIDGGEWSQVAGPFARKEYEAARAEHERMHPTRSEGQ